MIVILFYLFSFAYYSNHYQKGFYELYNCFIQLTDFYHCFHFKEHLLLNLF